jgi:hypothetical protein
MRAGTARTMGSHGSGTSDLLGLHTEMLTYQCGFRCKGGALS